MGTKGGGISLNRLSRLFVVTGFGKKGQEGQVWEAGEKKAQRSLTQYGQGELLEFE